MTNDKYLKYNLKEDSQIPSRGFSADGIFGVFIDTVNLERVCLKKKL